MTNKEIIKKAREISIGYDDNDRLGVVGQAVYISTAKNVREKMIDKACECLRNIINDDVLVKCGSVIKCMDVDNFVLYFRKAMEK